MTIRDGGDVTIVAGGWSAANVPVDRLAGRIIAVNEAAALLPVWHHAVSMDRLWAESRLHLVLLRSMEDSPHGEVWIRRNALQNFKPESLEVWRNLHPFECRHDSDEFSPVLRTGGKVYINGRSSGACALNLAWHLKPRRLFLVGYDMNRSPRGDAYWHPPYPWSSRQGGTSNGKYAAWARGIAHARGRFDEIGTAVFNVSPSSAIAAFRKITPAEYLELTR